MRTPVLPLALMLSALAPVVRAQPALAVTSTQSARLTQPTQFWRAGALMNATDLIIIRAVVRNRGDFVPQGISEPLFVFGSTVAILARSPLEDGQAIIIAPRATSAQRLWMSGKGVLPAKLIPPLIDRLRQRAIALQLSVQVSPAGGSIASFSNLEQLVRTVTIVVP